MSTSRQKINCDFNSTKTLGCNHTYSNSRLASCWLPLANSPWASEDLHSGPLISKEHCSAPLVSIDHCSGPLVSKDHCSGPLACPHVKGALIKWANSALQKSNYEGSVQ